MLPQPVNHAENTPAVAELPPGKCDAHCSDLFNEAVRMHRLKRFDLALMFYDKLLGLAPGLAEAWYNMGLIQLDQKNWRGSLTLFKKVLEIRPDFPDAAFQLATALKKCGHFDKALHFYQMSLDTTPHRPDAHYFKAICHQLLGASHEAIECMRQSTAHAPSNALYWFHLAGACLTAGRLDEAITAYGKAIDLKPDWVSAHHNMAVALRLAERVADAIDHLKTAIAIDPEYARAYPLLYRLAQHACDWDLAESVSRRLDEIGRTELRLGVKTTEPPLTNIRRCADVQTNMRIARSWSDDISKQSMTRRLRYHINHSSANSGKIRVGYLSGDFKDHAVAHQVRGLFENHDREKFEIHGYATNPDDGTAYRHELARACDHFNDVHDHSNLSVARQIHQDGVHILVDMAGHSRDNRLGVAALRPAPVQVSYLGFLSTTGADFIDYAIADALVVPKAHANSYTEKIAWLPHCYQANDNAMPIGPPDRDKCHWGLPDTSFVFCSFNQPYKIDGPLFSMWMRILREVENGVLWLVERSPLASDNLRHAASESGIDPSRLVFAGFEPLSRNLARLQLADLVLDTLTYNGGATTANALWAGVPVLTTLGSHWVSRMSASALQAIGMPELIARDADDYQRIAVALANTPSDLATIRRRLRRQRATAPLFDTSLFTRHMERAYIRMWQRHVNGQKPASFRVAP